MMYLTGSCITVTTTAGDFYFPVPCRGKVVAFSIIHNSETDADELFTLFRATTAVSVVTPTDATAAGVRQEGVMDATNGELIFDPDSATAANRVFHIDNLATVDAGAQLTFLIEYDESASQTQAPLEA